MAETIRLTPEELTPEREWGVAHGTVPVMLSQSTFDIPTSLTIEPDGGILRITFNYPDREEPEVRPRSGPGDLTFSLGKNSGKVLGLVVTRGAQNPHDITVRIAEGVDQEIGKATKANQRLNYKLILRLVRGRLERALAPA